jgi:hypothetical protein
LADNELGKMLVLCLDEHARPFLVLQNKWKMSDVMNFFSSVPYLNATAMLCQYPPVYGGPPIMYPPMTVLQPAAALLHSPGSQPNIPAASTFKQERKVCVCVFFCLR